MTTDLPVISEADAYSLGEKLRALRESLSAGELTAIEVILKGFAASVSEGRSLEDLLADLPDKDELLDDVAGFKQEAPSPDLVWTFTYTLPSFCCHTV